MAEKLPFFLKRTLPAAGMAVILSACGSAKKSIDPVESYQALYTAAGRCLHDTVYDSSDGALVVPSRLDDGTELIQVVAGQPGEQLLNFSVLPTGFLQFADVSTAHVLSQNDCPLPEGM